MYVKLRKFELSISGEMMRTFSNALVLLCVLLSCFCTILGQDELNERLTDLEQFFEVMKLRVESLQAMQRNQNDLTQNVINGNAEKFSKLEVGTNF